MQVKKQSAAPLVAGIFLIGTVLLNIFYLVILRGMGYYVNINVYSVIFYLFTIFLGTVLLARQRNVLPMIGAALLGLMRIVAAVLFGLGSALNVVSFLLFLASWILLAVVLAALIPQAGSLRNAMKKVYFLPAILMALAEVFVLISVIRTVRYMDLAYGAIYLIYELLTGVFAILGVFMAGKWAAVAYDGAPAAPQYRQPQFQGYQQQYQGYQPQYQGYQPQYQAYQPQQQVYQPQQQAYQPQYQAYQPQQQAYQPQPAPTVDPAEALANFRTLLDEGLITQEEFETRKRQLLGQ